MNRFIVDKFDDVFGKPDNRHDPDPTNDFVVPIVPTFGNNDILPHNILEPGPNRWTRKYLSIWNKFVPQEQRHSFLRGGWFFTEVIPNRLAVFSLNTLYFFDSNAAVDGCDAPTEPGYEHFEWLRIQLEFLRQRNMKAILMGHVPPARTESKQNWDETCYQKYNLWLRQYRDVIVGNIFGHMNLDHFFIQDVRELSYKFQIPGIDDQGLRNGRSINSEFSSQAKSEYLSELRQQWSNLPSPPRGSSYTAADVDIHSSKKKKKGNKHDEFFKEIGGPYGERFSLSVVSPSIVPNFYPTLRIIEYNITGLEHDHPALVPTAPIDSDLPDFKSPVEIAEQANSDDEFENDFNDDDTDYEMAKKKKHKKKKGRKPKPNFVIPRPPSKASPPGPGYSPQSLSLLSWTQLYANLTKINTAVAKELQSQDNHAEIETNNDLQTEMMKKHFSFEIEYMTNNDSAYSMQDLTVPSWLDYAEKIGRNKFSPKQIDLDLDLDREAAISRPYTDLAAINDESNIDGGEINEELRISINCLIWLWKLKNAALKVYDPHDGDGRLSPFLQRLKTEFMVEKLNFQPKIDNDDNDETTEDSTYDSDSTPESDGEVSDSGYDSEDRDQDNDNGDRSTTKHKKKKHRKHKKGKKRKGESLKNNHLWHTFVRRAFVETKTWDELRDEFG